MVIVLRVERRCESDDFLAACEQQAHTADEQVLRGVVRFGIVEPIGLKLSEHPEPEVHVVVDLDDDLRPARGGAGDKRCQCEHGDPKGR